MHVKQIIMIFLYLVTIVAANLLAAFFGAKASIIIAFVFIGFDLTLRDSLHEAWKKRNLWLKMFALIFAGSAISFLINRAALNIAIASLLAFLCAGIVDTFVYSLLQKKKWFIKINGSNLFSSLTDSLVFPTIAFGGFSLLITAGQFLAKFLGGFIWSLIIPRIAK
jgi:uncharacterized PurR-regulated membrane protein YhhQ (DUF165 family)